MKIGINRYILYGTLGISVVFISLLIFYFYEQRKQSADILLDQMRKELVEVSYTLSIKIDTIEGIDQFESMLARKAANSEFIKTFFLTNEHSILLTTDKSVQSLPYEKDVCSNLDIENPLDILECSYYKNPIYFFDHSKREKIYLYMQIDNENIYQHLNATLYRALMLFIVSIVLVGIVVYFIHKKFIIMPLELLRQFAYYQSKVPSAFRIIELEYVRSSLVRTFNRLENERKELYDLSRMDQLSGLMNRNGLYERSGWLIAEALREKKQFAVIFLDLDHFKEVNDSLGHEIGDALLKTVSSCLQEVIRAEDFVARIGGDEFVIVINNYESHLELTRIIQRLLDRIKIPFEIETHPVYVSASMGVVLYPKDGTDMNTLLKHADIAMYEAKRKGRDQYHFFTDSLNQKVQEDIRLERDMRAGLRSNEFKLQYQPKVSLKTGKIVGAEALLRWEHPLDGMIPPGRFIPLSENNGFIIQLGGWALMEALKQQSKWKMDAICDFPISVNISAIQFHDTHFLDKIKHILNSTGTKNEKVDIEVTESLFLDQDDFTLSIMWELQHNGITISMDDFGTGYSSLSYLKKFPMNTLKIDKSFLDDFESASGSIFIETIVKIGKTLGMSVVAEGVETSAQIEFLRKIECDQYQGYFCSKPLDASAFAELVQKDNIYL